MTHKGQNWEIKIAVSSLSKCIRCADIFEDFSRDRPPNLCSECFMSEEFDPKEWLSEKFPLCGCGSPEDVLAMLRDFLQMLKDRKDPSEYLPLVGGTTRDDLPLVGWFWLYFLGSEDIIEHGISCWLSWPTPKGEMLLEYLAARPIADIWNDM